MNRPATLLAFSRTAGRCRERRLVAAALSATLAICLIGTNGATAQPPEIPPPEPPQPGVAPSEVVTPEAPPAAPATPPATIADPLPKLVDDLRELAAQPLFAGITVHGADISSLALATGEDLRLRAAGGDLAQRAAFARDARSLLDRDPMWRDWLARPTTGVAVVFDDEPVDADRLLPIPTDPDEADELARLLQRVQDEIELDARLAGALVIDASFVKPETGPGRELQLRGKLASDSQRVWLSDLVIEAMAADPYWEGARLATFFTLRPLFVALPSDTLAREYYAMGLDAFWLRNYVLANMAFTRAVAESPASRILRYWRVVGLIASCETGRAERKLRPLIDVEPRGNREATIAYELERLQGPLRWQLMSLERQILITRYAPTAPATLVWPLPN